MADITAARLADLTTLTLGKLERASWTDISTDLQEFIVMPMILKEKKVQVQSGRTAATFYAQVGVNTNGKHVGFYNTDTTGVAELSKELSVPWSLYQNSFAFDVREIALNDGGEQLVNLLKMKRHAMMVETAKDMEDAFWGAPASSSDNLVPLGVDYWLVQNATQGFNGGLPSGFSDVAGLDPSTYTRWSNWTDTFSAVSKDDLIAKIRLAFYKTTWKSPHIYPDLSGSEYKRALYSTYAVVSDMERLAETQNTDLGNDLASKDGTVMIKRTPVFAVPKLDESHDGTSDDPVYGIDWNTVEPRFKKGWFAKESAAKEKANSHNTLVVFLDTIYQYVCTNRRRNFVLYQA